MKFLFILLGSALAPAAVFSAEPVAYDPLRIPDVAIVSKSFDVKDASRDRVIPIRVYFPPSAQPMPVILFSHGLGGSRDNNPYLGNHWAARGYVVVFVQHPGSDESVWKGAGPVKGMIAMKEAASLENFLARNQDIPAVIDALVRWNGEKQHELRGRLDPEHIGMSGHSFGAKTTQAVAGGTFATARAAFLEPRIDAAVMMSPGPPDAGDALKAFASIKIPCLLMTGTKDDSPIGNMTAADRLKVFPGLQLAPAWQVVFDKGTHMSFGDRGLMGKPQDGSRYHKAILALTTAFWDARLKGSATAQSWLNGAGARSVLVPDDKWERNAKAGE